MTDMMITTEGLVVGRGGMALTAPLDLSFAAGSVWQLTGPNGVGKTSLLRVLAGLLPSLSGHVCYELGQGARMLRPFDPFWMAQIGWLAVQPNLKSGPTVASHLQRCARLAGAGHLPDHGSDDGLLRRWGLSVLQDRPVQYLSQGQRRRVDLARLCLQQRMIWLLDEPTVTLDTQGREALTDAIDQHRQKGGLTILASHEALPFEGMQYLDLASVAS